MKLADDLEMQFLVYVRSKSQLKKIAAFVLERAAQECENAQGCVADIGIQPKHLAQRIRALISGGGE